jgi:hypothetical protein
MGYRLLATAAPPATCVLDFVDPQQVNTCEGVVRLELQISRSYRLPRVLGVLIGSCCWFPFLIHGMLHER